MKILISHSWNDKSLATKIYEVLKNDGHEVWYDIHQLIPGDNINEKIDVYIKKCEVMILIWTFNSFASDGVEAEINSAKKHGKRILPLQVDNTPLSHNSQLDGLLGIPFSDVETGMLLLQRAMLMLMATDTFKEADWFKESFGNVVDLGGYLNYVNTYRLAGNKNEDGAKDEWVARLEKLTKENEYIRQQLMPKAQNTMDTLNAMMKELEHGNVSSDKLKEWKQWCEANKTFQPHLISQLSAFIDQDIKRLEQGGKPVHSIDFELVEKAIKRLEQAIAQKKDEAFVDLCAKIKKYSFSLMPEKMVHAAATAFLKNVTACPQNLRDLMNEAKMSEFVAVKEVTYQLVKYLESQDHQLEQRKENLAGYYDDAYLINKTVHLLIEADLIPKKSISLDLVTSNMVDTYISVVLNKHTKAKLDAELQAMRDIIGLKKHEINWGQVAA